MLEAALPEGLDEFQERAGMGPAGALALMLEAKERAELFLEGIYALKGGMLGQELGEALSTPVSLGPTFARLELTHPLANYLREGLGLKLSLIHIWSRRPRAARSPRSRSLTPTRIRRW